jgi:two-component system CheB/CheR fusion protein
MARKPKYKDRPAESTPGVSDSTPSARSAEDVSLQDEAILVETSDGDSFPSKDFPIVGIGCSAGGLDAMSELLRALPDNAGMAYVIVQHMDPKHDSMLYSILARVTKMPVSQVEDGVEVRPDQVYVIPPNAQMWIEDGHLKLTKRPDSVAQYLPVDRFFESLAQDQHSLAIGVVLSGVGSDGTAGLRAIKAAGGVTFAQDEQSAKFSGMPVSAAQSGSVDFVMPVKKMAEELSRTGTHPLVRNTPREDTQLPGESENGNFARILRVLRTTSGVEFSLYKPSTLRRRIARRMVLRRAQNLGEYVTYLTEHPAEAHSLFEDILIHVTGFFREPEVFDALPHTVFHNIVRNASPGEPIRFWVPGCSSGEEAYSLAIELLEYLGEKASETRIQIFGTDVSTHNIERARAGIYPEASVLDISPQRLRRFFTKADRGYQIAKSIRDMCIFARHDLAKDPPFSRLDLVSCRNVLIYLGPVLQKRVMNVFHYALKPGGYLLLGKSETISTYSNLFTLEDKRHKIYARKDTFPHYPMPDMLGIDQQTRQHAGGIKPGETNPTFDLRREAERILLDRFTPPGFLVDGNMQILHFQGDVSPFLKPSTGEPSFDLVKMIRPDLVLEARKAVFEAKKRLVPVRRPNVKYGQDGREREIGIEAIPVRGRDENALDFMLLLVDQSPRPAEAPAEFGPRGDDEAARVRSELESTREYLRSVIQDYEASNEELRAANEEVLSSNEELQSTNEELETAKEELQSANEELTTLNEELQNRNAELTQLASDLSNVLVGVEIPIVILDSDRRIRRYTPAAERMLNLIPSDIGRPITNIKPNLDLPDLDRIFEQAMRQKAPVEYEVRDQQGRWYALRLRPYGVAEGEADAILMALVDIDVAKRASAAIVEQMREPLVVVDADFRIVTANPAFYKSFNLKPAVSEGHDLFEVGSRLFDFPRMHVLFEEVMPSGASVDNFMIEHNFRGIGARTLSLKARYLSRDRDRPPTVLITINDLTELKSAEQYKQDADRWMWHTFEDSVVPTCVLTPDRRYVRVNRAFCRFSGYTRGALAGKDVAEVSFTDDRKLVRHRFEEAIAADSVHYEQRFRHRNGAELWGFVSAAAVKDDSGAPLYILCQIVDITERKQFEHRLDEREAVLMMHQAKLRALAGRLIHEREQAVRAVAREAHDTFAQDAVASAMKLAAIEDKLDGLPAATKKAVGARVKEMRELAEGIHSFARRIHPSHLEELGLPAALKMEIDKFSKQYGISIKLREKGTQRTIPKDIALAVFRVCQESLHNIARHARAKNVKVSLTTSPVEVAMVIRDDGDGFDINRPKKKAGLGLLAMEERIRQVNGVFEITSVPGKYTEIEVHVPLK